MQSCKHISVFMLKYCEEIVNFLKARGWAWDAVPTEAKGQYWILLELES